MFHKKCNQQIESLTEELAAESRRAEEACEATAELANDLTACRMDLTACRMNLAAAQSELSEALDRERKAVGLHDACYAAFVGLVADLGAEEHRAQTALDRYRQQAKLDDLPVMTINLSIYYGRDGVPSVAASRIAGLESSLRLFCNDTFIRPTVAVSGDGRHYDIAIRTEYIGSFSDACDLFNYFLARNRLRSEVRLIDPNRRYASFVCDRR